MLLKNKTPATTANNKQPTLKKETIPTIITSDMNILGNIVSEGTVDFDGSIDGNIRCSTLTLRKNGMVKGEIVAESVYAYGKVHGLIRAKTVHLYASCHIEGIVMHEQISIEDGAFIDGKCKRTDKPQSSSADDDDKDEPVDEAESVKLLENIRLIR